MTSGRDQDLDKFVNPNLTWKNVKKGSRSAKKPARKNIDRGAESEKLGSPVLGKHIAEKITDVPIKKRKLFLPSPSPPPRTPSLNQEGSLSPHPNNSASDQEEQHLAENRIEIDGCAKSKKLEPKTEEFCDGGNLSGIALLAAVASGVEEHAIKETNDLLTVSGMKENVTGSESEGSSVPGNSLHTVLSLHCGNENDSGEKGSAPLGKAKFHWDLNKTEDEWEEPCFNLPQSSSRNCADSIVDDGLQCQNLKLEDCGRNEFEISSNKSDMINLFAPLASSTSSLTGQQDDLIGDLKRQDVDHGFTDDTTKNDFPEAAYPKKLVPIYHEKLVTEEADQDGLHFQKSFKCLDNDKLASEDPQSDVCGSKVVQDEQKQPANGNSMIRVQEGYESPYEDGELRESPVHAWDQREVGERENLCVDFKFDNEHKVDNSQAAQETSLLVEKNVDIIPRVEDGSSKPSSLYQSQEHCLNVKLEGKESNSKLYDEIKNGHDETRTYSGNMSPKDRSLSFSGLHRGDTVFMKRSRSSDVGETYFQTKREFASEEAMGRDRLPFQGYAKNEVEYRWADSAEEVWEWKDHYLNPRPRNVNGDYDRYQSRNYDPRGMYRPFNRRQSPTERNDSYGFHRGKKTMRGFSQERSRGRSRFSPEVFRRGGPQENYHGRGSYYLERKERGFSPSFSRDSRSVRPHRRSRSWSRSLSPIAWNMNKKITRPRSPKSRVEGPVQRGRLPLQKSDSSDDFEQGIKSPVRGRHLSPQRNSRCFDDRRPYRDRRSSPPGRMFKRNPRFDSVGPVERSKSTGEYFRPVTHPGRFSQNPGYDERSDDRRNPDERYETMYRLRRRDTSAGGTEKFRYDSDDCIEFCDAREVDGCFTRRAAPSSINEERSSPVIHQEKLTNTDALSLGEQDFDGNASTKEEPSSIKEENCSSVNHQEKLTNIDASLLGEQDFDGNASTKETPSSLKEEESYPVFHQEKLTNTDASLPGEQDFDGNTSAKEEPPRIKEEESSLVIHQEKLTNTDVSSHGEQDFDGNASTEEA